MWIKVGLILGVAYIAARPFLEYNSLVTSHAQAVSDALNAQHEITKARIATFRDESPPFDLAFANLTCDGPDYHAPFDFEGPLKDLVYMTDSPRVHDKSGASVEVVPPERLSDYSWRARWAAKSMPKRIEICEDCELTREYPFKIDKWRMSKSVSPYHVYDKKRANRTPPSGSGYSNVFAYIADKPIQMLVVRSPPRFEKVDTYVRGTFTSTGWVTRGTTKLEAVRTDVTYCAFSYPELKLLARVTRMTPPPKRSGEFPERKLPELGPKQVGGYVNYRYEMEQFLKSAPTKPAAAVPADFQKVSPD